MSSDINPRLLAAYKRLGWAPAWQALLEHDPEGQSLELCVHLRVAGRDILVAGRPVDLPRSDGTTASYRAAIGDELSISETYEPGSGSASVDTVTLSLADAGLEVATILGAGILVAGSCEVAIAFDGCPYEQRAVVLDGDLVGGVSFGGPSEEVEIQLGESLSASGYYVAPYVVTSDLWPSAREDAVGQRYPLVFNRWKQLTCLLVADNKAIACVPWARVDTTAISVYVDGDLKSTGDAYYGHSVDSEVDSDGHPYLAINFSGSVTLDSSSSEAITATVLVDPGTNGAPTYLHQLVAELLERFTDLGRPRINYELLGEVLQRLGAIPVRLLVNGSSTETSARTTEILSSTIADSFPMLTFAWVDGKYGPIVTDGRSPSVMDLEEGVTLLQRTSRVSESDKSDLVSSFSLKYAYDSVSQEFGAIATRSAANNVFCSRSAAASNGPQDDQGIESKIVIDAWVAELVVDWLAYHKALPHYEVSYRVHVLTARRCRPGNNVTLYVPGIGLSGVRATVVGRSYSRGYAELTFWIWFPELAGLGSGGGASTGSGGGGGGGN